MKKSKKKAENLKRRQSDFDNSSGIKNANAKNPGAYTRPGSNKKSQ